MLVPNSLASGRDGVATDLVVRLSSADHTGMGGKAASLSRLLRLGFPAPDGWVVTLYAGSLWLDGTLSDAELDDIVRERLSGAVTNMSEDTAFAVRSSADTEDSARASFAGQFRTELHVPGNGLPAAVRNVLASVRNPSALTYARRLGVAAPAAMAVLVQEQLAPLLSGVCFTVHPVTGEPAMVLEYAHGLGDTVAGGGAPDGTLVLPRLPDGTVDLDRLADLDPPVADRLAAVVSLAAGVERESGNAQDVEWAVDERGPWLVQARPVTTTGRARGEGCDH